MEQPYNASGSTAAAAASYNPCRDPVLNPGALARLDHRIEAGYTGNNQYRCNAAAPSIHRPNRSKSMPLRRFTPYLESVNNVDI